MKYLIFITFLLLISCDMPQPVTGTNIGSSTIELYKPASMDGNVYGVVTIEECEYISYALTTQQGMLTHKGNCKNPIHYNR